MALTYGFYNSQEGDRRYTAMQMSSIFDGIIEDGVFQSIGDQFEVTPGTMENGSKMAIKIGSGRAWFHHTWTYNSSAMVLPIDISDVMKHRIDMVVLEVDARSSVRKNSIKVIKGTPADNNPQPKALVNTADTKQYPLAHIKVNAKVTEITHALITNKIGGDDTPFVTGPITVMSAQQFWNQWNAEWDLWLADRFSEAQASNDAFDLWITQRKAAFTTIMTGHEDDAEAAKNAFSTWISDTKGSFNNTLDNIISAGNTSKDNFDIWIAQRKNSFNTLLEVYEGQVEVAKDDVLDWIDSKETQITNAFNTLETQGQTLKEDFETWLTNTENGLNSWITTFKSDSEASVDDILGDIDQEYQDFKQWTDDKKGEFTDWFDDVKDIFDENIVGNLQNQINDKAPLNHTHSVATTTKDGFMKKEDKLKLNSIATDANKYEHPTGEGYRHIPAGGSQGDVLGYSSAGRAVWTEMYSGYPMAGTATTPQTIRTLMANKASGVYKLIYNQKESILFWDKDVSATVIKPDGVLTFKLFGSTVGQIVNYHTDIQYLQTFTDEIQYFYYNRQEIDDMFGDLEDVLDLINGEVI